MGLYASTSAGWGWYVEPPVDTDDWYEWADDIVAGIDGLEWDACTHCDTGETPPILLLLAKARSAEAGTEPVRAPRRPNEGEVIAAMHALAQKGINVRQPDFDLWIGASYG